MDFVSQCLYKFRYSGYSKHNEVKSFEYRVISKLILFYYLKMYKFRNSFVCENFSSIQIASRLLPHGYSVLPIRCIFRRGQGKNSDDFKAWLATMMEVMILT